MIRAFKGKAPRIHPSAFVSLDAYVIGDVEIGENASIWPGVVIRAYPGKMTIGRNVNVQDGSILHSSDPMVIEDNVSIGHAVVVHASRVGAGSLLGNNSSILEGSSVGGQCLIAANAVAPANTEAPDRSFLVGVPGRVKGPVSEAQLAMMRYTNESVAEEGRLYKAEGLGHELD